MRWPLFTQRLPQCLFPVRRLRRPSKPTWRPRLESLEDRTVLSASLSLSVVHTLVPGNKVNTSHDYASEMQVDINPTKPLEVVGFTHHLSQDSSGHIVTNLAVHRSEDGGFSWTENVIGSADNGVQVQTDDGLGAGKRTDPTLKFDADGHLFIAYLLVTGERTSLVTARSNDGGANFTLFRTPDSQGNPSWPFDEPGLDKPCLTTGLDPATGRQAVYIAYNYNFWDVAVPNQAITVVGSNDGGFSYTQPHVIDDDDRSLFAGAAVGPNGELYVVWHDFHLFDSDQIRL